MGQALPFCVPCENKRGCDTCVDLHNWIMEKLGAVEVVRCKDCKHCEAKRMPMPGDTFDQEYTFYYCYHWDYEPGMSPNEVEANDFCSYGERRTDNGC